jgi:polysaccharide deacetylase family sporulation protein PdaB
MTNKIIRKGKPSSGVERLPSFVYFPGSAHKMRKNRKSGASFMIVIRLTAKVIRRCCVIVGLIVILILCFTLVLALRQSVTRVVAGGEKPIYAVERSDKVIALSFDASWGAAHTEDILAILDEYDVKTTFFLVNLWIEDYPELVAEIDRRGHEIGLHSATHPHFTALSPAEITGEIQANEEAVTEITGKTPTVFRFPYGDYNDTAVNTVHSLGLEAVQWSVDSLDWKELSASEISLRVLDSVNPGAIILMHNNGTHTAEALRTVIPSLLGEGYRIVPVSELLLTGDYYVDHNGIMHKGES